MGSAGGILLHPAPKERGEAADGHELGGAGGVPERWAAMDAHTNGRVQGVLPHCCTTCGHRFHAECADPSRVSWLGEVPLTDAQVGSLVLGWAAVLGPGGGSQPPVQLASLTPWHAHPLGAVQEK